MAESRPGVGRRLLRLAGRLTLGAVIVVVGVSLAKIAQGLAVERFGPALGFDLASFVGVVPVIVLFYWLAHRFPRLGGRRE